MRFVFAILLILSVGHSFAEQPIKHGNPACPRVEFIENESWPSLYVDKDAGCRVIDLTKVRQATIKAQENISYRQALLEKIKVPDDSLVILRIVTGTVMGIARDTNVWGYYYTTKDNVRDMPVSPVAG